MAPGEVVTMPFAAVVLTGSVSSNNGRLITSESPEAAATSANTLTIPANRASETVERVTGRARRYSRPPVSSSPAIAPTPSTTPSAISIHG